MSVTGWALMFLRSARNAEFNVPKQYFDEGLDFVERCYEKEPALHDKGVFRYRPLESDPTANPQITLANTASSMLTLILGGRHTHAGIPAGAERNDGAAYSTSCAILALTPADQLLPIYQR